jgi:hypothetical protein
MNNFPKRNVPENWTDRKPLENSNSIVLFCFVVTGPQCAENSIYVFPEMKLRGRVPISYIHVSVSDLYIPRIGLPILRTSLKAPNMYILQIVFLNRKCHKMGIFKVLKSNQNSLYCTCRLMVFKTF